MFEKTGHNHGQRNCCTVFVVALKLQHRTLCDTDVGVVWLLCYFPHENECLGLSY